MVVVAVVSGWTLTLLLGGFRRWFRCRRGVGVWGGRDRVPLVRFGLRLEGASVALGLCPAGLSGLRALLFVVFGSGGSAVPPAWALARAPGWGFRGAAVGLFCSVRWLCLCVRVGVAVLLLVYFLPCVMFAVGVHCRFPVYHCNTTSLQIYNYVYYNLLIWPSLRASVPACF